MNENPALQELAAKIKRMGLEIFDGPECPQQTRDALEWFANELSVSQLPTTRAESCLRAVIAHWDEFGPEHGFAEAIDNARLPQDADSVDDALNHAYAEGRKDEREALAQICDEEAARIRIEGRGCTDGRYDWMAQGVEAVADTFRGIDSAAGQPADMAAIREMDLLHMTVEDVLRITDANVTRQDIERALRANLPTRPGL